MAIARFLWAWTSPHYIFLNKLVSPRHFGKIEKNQHLEKEDLYLVIFALISEMDVIYFSLLTRIQALLQQRVKHANTVADIYLFAAEFLRISSETDPVQVLFW